MLRVLFLAPEPGDDIHQVRIHMPLYHLHESGHVEVTTKSFDEVRQTDVQYSDVVILNHPTHPEYWPTLQKVRFRYNKPVIVDVDDLLTNVPVDHPERRELKWVCYELPKVLHGANKLVVSTDYLALEYGHLNPNITVIENSVKVEDIERVKVVNKPYHKGFVVGWVGGKTHVNDQHYTFMKGLQEFTRRHDDVRLHFKFLCPQPFVDEFGVRCFFDEEFTPYAEYPAYLSTVPWDVCLCGLYDHPFNHAKSDLRLLDVALHEIPLIASPVHQFARHFEKGIIHFADDRKIPISGSGEAKIPADTWLDSLEYAYRNQGEMKEMAADAKKYVVENRTSLQMASKWWDVLKEYDRNRTADIVPFSKP